MNPKIVMLVALALLVAGCSRSSKMQRGQQQYQTVQEGSASGVTSTINGPGETPAPLTDTSVDTTTNFTLPANPNPLGNETTGTTFVGSLPPNGSGMAPPPRVSRPRADTHGMAGSSAPVVTDTIGNTTPPMPKDSRSTPRSDPAPNPTTSTADPATTTLTSSETAPRPPAPKKKPDDSNKSQDQPQPPPPPTDTTGTRG